MIALDRDLDQLFQAPFAEFVGARNALAARLKQAGLAGEAARVRGLAKPTYTAWLVNQLYWGARREFDAFLKAAERVRAGEKALLEGRRSAQQAAAATERKEALQALVERARARAAEESTPLSPALAERLRTTLDAIGLYGAAAARHAKGRLQDDLDPPGFSAFAALAAGTPARKTTPAPPPLVLVRSTPKPELTEARARVAAAQAEAARRQDALTAATDAERRAKASVDHAVSRHDEAERALQSAKAELEAARSAQRARQTELRNARQEAAAADRALEKANGAVEKLT